MCTPETAAAEVQLRASVQPSAALFCRSITGDIVHIGSIVGPEILLLSERDL